MFHTSSPSLQIVAPGGTTKYLEIKSKISCEKDLGEGLMILSRLSISVRCSRISMPGDLICFGSEKQGGEEMIVETERKIRSKWVRGGG